MKLQKNYEKWHKLKCFINASKKNIYFNEREIWFCSIGFNIGYEQDGKNDMYERPVIILKKFNNRIFLGIPITSTVKDNKFYYVFNYKNKQYSAILSQIRLLDAKRLTRKIRFLLKSEFTELKLKLKNLI